MPSEYTSALPSTCAAPKHCSGAMYAGVPMMSPVRVRGGSALLPGPSLAIPKSKSFTRSPSGIAGSGMSMTLLGLRSVHQKHVLPSVGWKF